MDIAEVKQFIESNKDNEEVKGVIKEYFNPTFDDLIKDEKIGKAIISYKDSEVSKGVDSFIKTKLPSKIEEEVTKRLKETNTKEPWAIEIENLKNAIETKDRAYKIETQKSKVMKNATEKGIPIELIDFIVSDDEEKTNSNFNIFNKVFESFSTKTKQDILKNHNIPLLPSDKKTSIDTGLPDGLSKKDYLDELKKKLKNK